MRHTRLILAGLVAGVVALPFAGTSAFAAGTPTLTTWAGIAGTPGAPTPGPATSSNLAYDTDVVENSVGDLYVADAFNRVVEEITPTGTLSIVAGTGTEGPATPGPATSSDMVAPTTVAVNSSGDLYIADEPAHEVYEVTPGGTLSVVAGTGSNGVTVAGPATSADISDPCGVAVNSAGDLYISDEQGAQILEVTPGGTLSIIAGTGTAGLPTPGPASESELDDPTFLAVDAAGNLYVADSDSDTVDEITPGGTLSIVAGVEGTAGESTAGPATSSDLSDPTGLAFDSSGDLFIANAATADVDEVTPGGTLSLIPALPIPAAPVTHKAGVNGHIGFEEAGELPYGIAVDQNGTLYLALTNDTVGRYGIPTPNAATSLSETRTDTTATVTFTPPSYFGASLISGYEVSLDGGNTWQPVTTGGTSPLTATITGLNQTTGYTVEVEAVNSQGAGTASVALSIPAVPATPTPTPTPTPAPQPPPAPAPQPGRFTASAKGATAGRLTVTAHTPGAGTVNALATEADKGNNAGLPSARAASLKAPMPAPGFGRFAYATGSMSSTSSDMVTLTLKLTAAGRAIIARHHNHGWTLHVRVTVLYTSSTGTVQMVTLPMIEIFGAANASHRASKRG